MKKKNEKESKTPQQDDPDSFATELNNLLKNKLLKLFTLFK